MSYKSASIICVGTELLLGNITNTNSRYIASRLAALGIPLYREFTVGDNPSRMKETFIWALESSDLVIATGGLGPTRDDITRETVCELMGAALVRDEEAERRLRSRFAAMGREMTDNNLRQAYLPEGCTPFYNSNGTAPGFALSRGGKTVIVLPGVPHEMKGMFEEWAQPYIARESDYVIVSRYLHVYNLGESLVDDMIGDLEDSGNPTVAPYCKGSETRLRISARAEDEARAKEMLDSMEEQIRQRGVGEHIYYVTENDEDADRAPFLAVAERFCREGKTLAFAESITGGLLGKIITDIPGASAFFRGSAVTYATDAKISVLGVKAETVEKYGVVSEEVAGEMARGGREKFGADVCAAVTGIASASPEYGGGYTPGGEEIESGTVCIAVADEDGVWTETCRFGKFRSREEVRSRTAERVFGVLARKS